MRFQFGLRYRAKSGPAKLINELQHTSSRAQEARNLVTPLSSGPSRINLPRSSEEVRNANPPTSLHPFARLAAINHPPKLTTASSPFSIFGAAWFPEGVGKRIEAIHVRSLLPSETAVSSKTPYRKLATYNWVHSDGGSPRTMYFPGAPPFFTDHALPYFITRQRSQERIKRMALKARDRIRNSPLGRSLFSPFVEWKSVLQAIEAMSPDFRFNSVDILSSFSKLRALLALCGLDHHNIDSNIHFHLALVHNTLVISSEGRMPRFTRIAKGDEDDISAIEDDIGANEDDRSEQEHDISAMGKDFEEAFTKWPLGLGDSDTHQRVLQYDMGHLNCVISAGVDTAMGKPVPIQDRHISRAQLLRDHSTIMIPRGFNTDVPTAEIKSRRYITEYGKIHVWFNRADFYIGGKLKRGLIDTIVRDVRIENTDKICDTWENDELNQIALRRLTALLSKLREVVRGTKEKQCYISRGGRYPQFTNELFVYSVEDGSAAKFMKDVGKYWGDDPK